MASADQISFRNLGRRSSRRPLRKAKSTTQASGAQRSVCASGGEGRVRIDAGTIKKGNSPPQLPRQRLAKRKARKEQLVKFDLCPITSECSTAYWVRKSNESPARVPAEAASIEQDSLEPRPAARQGASRARNCAAKSVFSFDGSTAVFFLGLTKKKMGVESPPGFPGTTGRSTGVQRKIFGGFCMGTCQKQVRGTLSLTGFAWKYTALGPGGRGI